MEETLSKLLGIDHLEAKIYLNLLKIGPSSILEIANETGLARSSVYSCLEHLKKLGLITEQKKNGRRLLKATDPKNITEILKEKKEEVEKILPDLNDLVLQGSVINTHVYSSLIAVRRLYRQAAKTKEKVVRMIYSLDKVKEMIPEEIRLAFTASRLENGTTARTIYTSNKSFCPWELIHYEAYKNSKDARRREKYLKTNQGARLLKIMLKEHLHN